MGLVICIGSQGGVRHMLSIEKEMEYKTFEGFVLEKTKDSVEIFSFIWSSN